MASGDNGLEFAFVFLIFVLLVVYVFVKRGPPASYGSGGLGGGDATSSTSNKSSSTSSSGLTGNSALNIRLSLGGSNVAVGDVYYIQGDMSGYYYCGMQGVGGNQTVRYTWTLKVKGSPQYLAAGSTIILDINYFDTAAKSWVTPVGGSYTKTWSLTLDESGETSQQFQDCLVPHSVRAESSVGVKVVKVLMPNGEPVSFKANTITLIPQ